MRPLWPLAPLPALALALAAAPAAAQQPPPPSFSPRAVTWALDKTSLRVSVSYRDIVDADIAQKLKSGIPTLIVLSGLLYEKGSKGSLPGVLLLKSCRVVYDVWDDVYSVEVTQAGASSFTPAVLTLDGVLRRCAQVSQATLVERSRLKVGVSYEFKAVVQVNPVSQDQMDRIKRWISRPKGTSTVGAGDALFGSFVGLFVAQIDNADRVLRFFSQNAFVMPPPPPPPPPKK